MIAEPTDYHRIHTHVQTSHRSWVQTICGSSGTNNFLAEWVVFDIIGHTIVSKIVSLRFLDFSKILES